MRVADVGELLTLFGIVVVVTSAAGLAISQSAPVNLEIVSWAGSTVIIIGIILIFVSN